MLTVQKEVKGDALVLKFSGSIDESAHFPTLIGEVEQSIVRLNTKEVPRINSVGVKGWIKFFQGLSEQGRKLIFEECSTAIVEQINLISNFSCGGEVESLFIPFVCQDCGSELVGLFGAQALKKANFELPSLKCSKCNSSNAKFDDIPEEYFHFLMKD